MHQNWWDFFTESGMKANIEKHGFTINPTHNADLLKGVRESLYREQQAELLKERVKQGLSTTAEDLKIFEQHLNQLHHSFDMF